MQSKPLRPCLALQALAAALMLAGVQAQAAVNSGSTGADGALSPKATVELPLPDDGVLNYTSVNIPAGVTVTYKKNKRNTPVYMLVQGNVDIAGTISVRGGDAKHAGTYGDGVLGDDGQPGLGGNGGFDGGRGGQADASYRAEVVNGGAGQGPGGGAGGVVGDSVCTPFTSAYSYAPGMGVGGGHASPAYRGSTQWCGATTNVGAQFMGKAYGSNLLQPLIGGSGGGGGRGSVRYGGSGGGGGGGALLIAANGTITLATGGAIDASGGDAGGVGGGDSGFWGAGGAGGAIRLVASRIAGAGSLLASGGCANYDNRRYGCSNYSGEWSGNTPGANGGSVGRIRLEADSHAYNGSPQGSFSKDAPGPIFLSNTPSLRIVSVADIDVPAEPSGSADVNLPTAPAGPVTVVFKTFNVPPGNTVTLRVAPESGAVVEVVSQAISGSTAEGSASVAVTLPAGASSLMAMATYTVPTPLAAAPALSQYANNEKVEQIELTVASEGEPKAQLITATGRRFDISYAQLLAAGFQG